MPLRITGNQSTCYRRRRVRKRKKGKDKKKQGGVPRNSVTQSFLPQSCEQPNTKLTIVHLALKKAIGELQDANSEMVSAVSHALLGLRLEASKEVDEALGAEREVGGAHDGVC